MVIKTRKIKVTSNVKFLDKTKNKTKNITINNYGDTHGINKTIQVSQGRYELKKFNKLRFLIEGNVYKNVINIYMKSNNTPIL